MKKVFVILLVVFSLVINVIACIGICVLENQNRWYVGYVDALEYWQNNNHKTIAELQRDRDEDQAYILKLENMLFNEYDWDGKLNH